LRATGREIFATVFCGVKAFADQGRLWDKVLTALKRELARVKKERDFSKEAAEYTSLTVPRIQTWDEQEIISHTYIHESTTRQEPPG
jgi:hypothetical protein